MVASSVEWLAHELADITQRFEAAYASTAPSMPHPTSQAALSSLARLQAMLQGPSEFLQRLAIENQILSCLRWLCEFQVLACIPLDNSVPIKDLSELLGIPEAHLDAVVRLMAAAGFLCQPQPCHVGHTALSAHFLSDLSLLDAARFLGEYVAPAALHMAEISHQHINHDPSLACADGLPSISTVASPVQDGRAATRKLNRQWLAFLPHIGGGVVDPRPHILARFDWFNLGKACVVDVGAESCTIAETLSGLYPSLDFVVQFYEEDRPPAEQLLTAASAYARASPNPRVTVQQQRFGMPQSVRNAAAYILRLPAIEQMVPGCMIAQDTLSIRDRITAELRAHLDVLHANSATMVILTARIKSDGDDSDKESKQKDKGLMPQLNDLVLLQLTRQDVMRYVDLLKIIEKVHDKEKRLAVVHRLASPYIDDIALVIKAKLLD